LHALPQSAQVSLYGHNTCPHKRGPRPPIRAATIRELPRPIDTSDTSRSGSGSRPRVACPRSRGHADVDEAYVDSMATQAWTMPPPPIRAATVRKLPRLIDTSDRSDQGRSQFGVRVRRRGLGGMPTLAWAWGYRSRFQRQHGHESVDHATLALPHAVTVNPHGPFLPSPLRGEIESDRPEAHLTAG
jgi:hypothetical protein